MSRWHSLVGICGALVVGGVVQPHGAVADTVYHCGYKDGAPVFTINVKPKGVKCRVYSSSESGNAKPRPKGAKCRSQRYRDTVFYSCVKDGIWWYYNKNDAGARGSGTRSAGNSGTNGGSSDFEDVVPMPSRRIKSELDAIVAEAGRTHRIPEALLRAVIEVESGFRPDVVSPAGAQGLMQLMPVTADSLQVEDPFDPYQNVMAGAKLLRILSDRFNGEIELVIAAYYAGAGAVRRAGGIPTTSAREYVRKVLDRYQKYNLKEKGIETT